MAYEEQVDVCIIGGGVNGLYCALEMARAGLFVRVVDKKYSGSSRFNIGEVSLMEHDSRLNELLKLTMKAWQDSAKEFGQSLGMTPKGAVQLALTSQEAAHLKHVVDQDKAEKFKTHYVDNKEELQEILGGVRLGENVTAARISPLDAIIDTRKALSALHQLLIKSGVKFWGSDEVTEFLMEDNQLTGIKLSTGEICKAKTTVVCAGAFASKLLSKIGVKIPIRPARCHLIYFSPNGKLPLQMVSHRLPYGHIMMKQVRDGRVMVAYDGLMDQTQATFSTEPDEELYPYIKEQVGNLLGAMHNAKIDEIYAVSLAVTPDFMPCIGPYGNIKGLQVAVGFNGRSYAFAAGAAKILLALVKGEDSPIDLTPFQADRFATGMWEKIDIPKMFKTTAVPEEVPQELKKEKTSADEAPKELDKEEKSENSEQKELETSDESPKKAEKTPEELAEEMLGNL